MNQSYIIWASREESSSARSLKFGTGTACAGRWPMTGMSPRADVI